LNTHHAEHRSPDSHLRTSPMFVDHPENMTAAP
jgi:hypothetical protein